MDFIKENEIYHEVFTRKEGELNIVQYDNLYHDEIIDFENDRKYFFAFICITLCYQNFLEWFPKNIDLTKSMIINKSESISKLIS